MRLLLSAAIAAALILAEAPPLTAAPLFRMPSLLQIEGARALGAGKQAGMPKGYFELCRNGHSVCKMVGARGVATTRNGAVVLSAALAAQLVNTNSAVNRGMRAVHDQADRWTVGGQAGDCEDFALTKKMRLMRAGWPSSALLMATAVTQSGEPHAVLIVRTDNGDVVLDNLTDSIRGWNRAGVRIRSVQSPSNVWVWRKV